MAGVSSVDANPITKNVVVNFDPGVTNVPAIESKMAEAGYPVTK